MASRRVVVGSASGPVSSEKSQDLGNYDKKDDDQLQQQERRIKFIKQYSFLTSGDTWEDAVARETEAIQQNVHFRIYAPLEFQLLFEKAILFPDSKFLIIRLLRPIVILCANLELYFVSINSYYINADILFSIGWFVGCSAVPVMWYIVYFTQDIRGDSSGKLGPGLRVYQLLQNNTKIDAYRRIPIVTLYEIILGSFFMITILYMIVRWHDVTSWNNAAQLLFPLYIMIPHASIPMMICMFPFTMDASARLIESQKVFVYDEITGCIDWPVVQRNFDILETFVLQLSKAWAIFFFGASACWPLALVMLGIGVGNTGMQWMQGDQPSYMPILIAFEALVLAYILLTTIILWNGASQVTAACETVSKHCQEVLSYLRMHPSYMSHREEYLKAEDFARYVENAKLGFKANGICISYSLGMAILYPVLGAIFAVILPLTIPSLISVPAGG